MMTESICSPNTLIEYLKPWTNSTMLNFVRARHCDRFLRSNPISCQREIALSQTALLAMMRYLALSNQLPATND
jgi:hypothetical protein